MADAIYGIISYDGLQEIFQEQGKAEVDTINWDSAAAQIKNIYSETISK
jgi:hypothetical protein